MAVVGVLEKVIAGGLVMVAVTSVAERIGGQWGGLMGGFPALFLTSVAVGGVAKGVAANRFLAHSTVAILLDVFLIYWAPRLLRVANFGVSIMALIGGWAALAFLAWWMFPGGR